MTWVSSSSSLMAIVFVFLISGVFNKYCFSCLHATAHGDFKAPTIGDAFAGSVILSIQIYVLYALMAYSVYAAYVHIGPSVSFALMLVYLLAMPAMMITLAISQSFLQALNFVNVLKLIMTIGLPYGLLLALLFIMISSVVILSQLVLTYITVPLLGAMLIMGMALYYTLVAFHIMGYMIFQYQSELGFIARDDEDVLIRSDKERDLAYLDVLLKEADFDTMIQVYSRLIITYPEDKKLYTGFLISCWHSKILTI